METTRPAALFFDPGLPPAALPILTSHTDLHSVAHPPRRVLAHEELPHLDATHPVSHPPRQVLGASAPNAHARTHPRNPVRPRESDPCDDEDEGAASDDTESTSRSSRSSTASDDPDTKIPKPDGEPGRPGRGGYNLQRALNWNVSAYNKLKVRWRAHPLEKC